MRQKIGFWAVFALVAGSQIGSGVFMQPASLAPYGYYALLGWLISGTGAIALALVFGALCSKFPKTGGPNVYVNEAFGPTAGFFTGWAYWVISWVSTPVLYAASAGYISPLLGNPGPGVMLGIELGLLFFLTWLNLRGVQAAGRAEFVLSLLKVIPLIIMPLAAFFFFDSTNFTIGSEKTAGASASGILSSVALLTLWGFIGLETATTAAGSVENPKKTIPQAIFIGTVCVALLYFVNSLSIMGLIPGDQLAQARAPYADAAQTIFGGSWHLLVAAIAAVVCIGTANAWTLSSGQAALGLAESGMMPAVFKKKNRNGAPTWAILTSCIGIVPILVLTASESLVTQINTIIDFSVTAFLYIYLACVASFFKIHFRTQEKWSLPYLCAGLIGAIFCIWVLLETPWHVLFIATLFVLSGLPLYLWQNRCSKEKRAEKKILNLSNENEANLI